jgi:hypothetical protein
MMVTRSVLAAALLLAAEAPTWTGESGGFTVRISRQELRAVRGERTVLSLAARHQPWLAELEKEARNYAAGMAADEGDLPSAEVESREEYAPLSLVGPFLSLASSSYSYWPGAAHPNGSEALETIDLRAPGTPVRLDQIFTDAQILAALLDDREVRPYVKGDTPHTLEELAQTLGEEDAPCEHRFVDSMLEHFAFYDVVGEKVAVRIATEAPRSYNCEVVPGTLIQLSLLLDIPAALKSELSGARDGSAGFLMKAAGIRFKDAPVSFVFKKDLKALIEAARKKKRSP